MLNKNLQPVLQKLLTFMFFIFIFIPSLLYPFLVNALNTKTQENRVLHEKPTISLSTLETYPKEFEDYYNDNLPFKYQLTKLNAYINFTFFHTTTSLKVILGKEDWLFHRDISEGDPISYYQGIDLFSDEELASYCNSIVALRDSLASQGKEFLFFVPPIKERVYSIYMPDSVPQVNTFNKTEQLVAYLIKNTDITVIYPMDEFLELRDAYPLYYKNDTHWNELGAFIGAQQLLESLIGSRSYLENVQFTYGNKSAKEDLSTLASLSGLVEPDMEILISNYFPQITIKDTIQITPELSLLQSSSAGSSLMIIGDSYADGMIPYLSKHFSNIYSCHWRNATGELIKDTPTDIVVFQMLERYLDTLPEHLSRITS